RRSQSRHRQRILGGPPGLLPERADLLQSAIAGPGRGPVSRSARPSRLPRHRSARNAAVRRACRCLRAGRAGGAYLPAPMSANERRRFDVVAIGASAGGVQALLSILPALPVDFAPAMLVVLHVSSERPCALAALLAEHCRLPVSEAFDKQPIEEGTV